MLVRSLLIIMLMILILVISLNVFQSFQSKEHFVDMSSDIITPTGIQQITTRRALTSNIPCRIKTKENTFFQFKVDDQELGWYDVPDQPNVCALDISGEDINNNVANCSRNNGIMYEKELIDDIYINDFTSNRRCEVKFKNQPSERKMVDFMGKQVSYSKLSECKQAFREVARLTEETNQLKEELTASVKAEEDARRVIAEKEEIINNLKGVVEQLKSDKAEVQGLISDKQKANRDLESQISQLAKEISDNTTLKDTMISNHDTAMIKERQATLDQQIAAANALLAQNKAEENALKMQLDAKDKDIKDFKSRITTADGNAAAAARQLATAVENQKSLLQQVNTNNARIAELKPTPPPRSIDPVVLCQHCDYGGYNVSIRESGRYNMVSLQRMGFYNDDISSIRVPQGWKVTIFEHDNFVGKSLVLTSDNSCLVNNGFNDAMSSMIVERLN